MTILMVQSELWVAFLTLYRPAMPFGNRKYIFVDLLSSVLSQSKKYHPFGNLKFYK